MICAETTTGLAWGLQRLNIQTCWQRGFTGAGVRVGHLDTGVDGGHPALRGRVAAFVEFDQKGYPIQQADARDSGLHGTHTAGIICGQPRDHTTIGVAPDSELYSGMVIEGGKCLVRVLAGLDWMLDCKVRVLCLSLGIPVYNPLYEIVLNRMKRAGVLVIAPVGNRGRGHTCSPANYPGVIAVGSMNSSDKMARFSGGQLLKRAADFVKPNLVAPGVDIFSARAGGGYHALSGTSMAAAHVAGVAALLFQARPGASEAQVAEALLATCTPLPGSSERRCGAGVVNPVKAMEMLLSDQRSFVACPPM